MGMGAKNSLTNTFALKKQKQKTTEAGTYLVKCGWSQSS